MTRVPLRARDGSVRAYALIDDVDAGRVLRWRWSLHRKGYACRVDAQRRTVLLHRFVLGLEHGDRREGDHRDLDRLNCRRSNLRVVTRTVNAQNVRPRLATSRFRGVSWRARAGRWRVQIAGRTIGLFADELEAAVVAERVRLERMPGALPCPVLAAALIEMGG